MRQGRAKASRERSVERGFPPPRRTIGSGERRKLPMQRGPGQSPDRKRFYVHLKLENVTSGE